MKRSAVGIADIVVATSALRPNAAAREAIVRMCGMDFVPRQRDAGTPQPAPVDDDSADDEAAVTGRTGEPQLQLLPPSVRRLEPVRQLTRPTPRPDPLASAGSKSVPATPTFEGLLTVRDGIELLRMASSVFVAADKLDIPRITRRLAYAQPLTDLPRLRVPSLALGAQILVDVGQSMQPFHEDQQDLVKRIKDKRSVAEVLYYADDPASGCGPERRRNTWHEYQLPLPQVPVIVLTDLGCGYPRRPDALRAWLRLAEQLRRRQSRVVVFAAVRLDRVPNELARAVDLVLWDRSAVRRNVMQLAGAGNE